MKQFTRLIALLLVVLMLPTAHAISLSLDEVFQGDSYWVMEYTDFDGNVQSVYHVYLEWDHQMCHIVDDRGMEYMDCNFGWSYEPKDGVLKIDGLEDGWNSGVFVLRDGAFISPGAYHNTKLTYYPNGQLYNDRAQIFRWTYGSRNFAKQLTNLFTYQDHALLSDPDYPYETFRYMAMFKALGVVVQETGDAATQFMQEVEPLLGGYEPNNYHVDSVLADIEMPVENDGTMRFGQRTEIMNLVYYDPQICNQAFAALSGNRDALLTGESTEWYACANDGFAAWADGNADQLVVICELPYSVFVFRGPNSQVRQIMDSLGMGFFLNRDEN